ncbi:MAG TPA: sugar ABC transporter ATP-binding protein [Baekduia sp.]|nr:sugar ABC transporter ATP-binding protein [Baekduia sp.]
MTERDVPAEIGELEIDITKGLYVKGISKAFAGTQALDDVTAHFPRGSITALLGQNGSGKSTLIKILAGFYSPDGDGQVTIGGVDLDLPVNPRLAHAAGLRFLHQDLGLVAEHSIADNFAFADRYEARMLGRIRQRRENARVARALERFGIDAKPGTMVANLTPTERTMVAIARAFIDEKDAPEIRSNVIIMDEPTASLPASEVDRVFGALEHVRDAGGTVVFVSHRIDEVLRIADRLVVLRDGKMVTDRSMEGLKAPDVVTLIIGHSVERGFSDREAPSPEVVLEARGLTGRRLKDVDLELHRGEILGVTGLLGCGRSELARIVAGAQPAAAGTLVVDGEPIRFTSPRDAIAAGIGFVPQERRSHGCIPDMSVRENLTLSGLGHYWRGGWLRQGEERSEAWNVIEEFDIRPADPDRAVAKLSGGNQQKAVVAKWTRLKPRVLVLDEPTQGVDIGAKREIASIARDLADQGVAVLVGSSDVDELVELCDRVLVLNRGEIVADVDRRELSEERLTLLSTTTEEITA